MAATSALVARLIAPSIQPFAAIPLSHVSRRDALAVLTYADEETLRYMSRRERLASVT
jgi:hypothetical protein